MATLGSLVVSLEANIAQFTAGMNKSAYIAEQTGRSIQKSLDMAKNAILGVTAAALGISSISGLWDAFKGVVETQKNLTKTAEQLGATVEELSGLQFVAKKSGMEVDVFNSAMQRYEKNLARAALGTERAKVEVDEFGEIIGKGTNAFRQLGIVPAELKKLSLPEQVKAIAERFKDLPSAADKSAIALELFGKAGGKMVIYLNQGAAGIDTLIERGKLLGIVYGDNVAKGGAEAAKSLGELNDALNGLKIVMAAVAAPIITDLANRLTNSVLAAREAGGGFEGLTEKVREFANEWQEPTLKALKMGILGLRIGGLKGAALGAAAGFMGLTSSLRELSQAMENPAVLALMGGALGSRLGLAGAGAGALGGALAGILGGIKRDAAKYEKEQKEGLAPGLVGYGTEGGGHISSYSPRAGLYTDMDRGIAGKGAKGGAGGALNRIQTIIDELNREIARIAEGSYAAVDAWAAKMVNSLAELGRKGANVSEALAKVEEVAALKKIKINQEFYAWVAQQSGDAYFELEAQSNAWLAKVGGNLDQIMKIWEIKSRKEAEIDQKNIADRLSLEKSFYDQAAGLAVSVRDEIGFKRKALELEIELNRIQLDQKLQELQLRKAINAEDADRMRATQALIAQQKRFSFEQEQDKGLTGWASERVKETERRNTVKDLMGGLESGVQSAFAAGIQGVLSKDKASLKKIGETMFGGFIGEIHKGGITRSFDALAKMIAPGGGKTGGDLTKAASGLQNAATGLDMSSVQLAASAGGLLLSGIGIAVNSQELVIAGTVLQMAGMAIQAYQAFAGVSLNTAAITLNTAGINLNAAAIALGAGSGGGGFLSGIGGFVLKGLAGIAGAVAAPATGGTSLIGVSGAYGMGLLGMHSGGIITAHQGWPKLASDERIIRAQVGERVLSRAQNREYEAGLAGGRGPVNVTVNIHPRQEMTEADYRRHARLIRRAIDQDLGRNGRAL